MGRLPKQIHTDSNLNPLIRCSSCRWFKGGHFQERRDERWCMFHKGSVSTTNWCASFERRATAPKEAT